MTELTERAPAQGRRKRRRAAVIVPIVVAAGVAGAATMAYGLWSASQEAAGGTVTAGDLALQAGTASWAQVTPGVTNPGSGTLTSTPTDFYSMPGDVIEIVQPVTTYLRGENLNGGLSVTVENPSGDIDTSFVVRDDAGNTVTAPAELGDVVAVPGLVGSNDGVTASWEVVVTVDVLGDYQWVTPENGAGPGTWSAGSLDVTLSQVRQGPGYEVAP